MIARTLFALALALSPSFAFADDAKPLKVLFLGDNGGHKPADRFRQLQPALAKRGIELTYTDKADALSARVLASYDALVIFANTTEITPEQEKALLDFVEGGKGFVPLHCASFCFLNSPKYVDLVGAQFQRHDAGVFRTKNVAPEHPVMKGFGGFESWDETYTHTKHNDKGRTVLELRDKEPWTWVRDQGKGRVFYTAWGHDDRTWSNPGFVNLVERGIRWSAGQDLSKVPAFRDAPVMTTIAKDAAKFDHVEANVPFYPASRQWGTLGEPIKQMQKPLSSKDSMTHYVHPQDFELKLFADETLLGGKPLAMNWDERGRLWLILTRDYPNELQPTGKGRDRIVVVEDINDDGVGDKVSTFADQLSIPTSLTFANGGVIVTQAPDMLFLKDTDGDGKADVRKVLFTGFHTNDTHAGPSNLTYGPDNWMYAMIGYAGFDGVVGGEKHSFRQGFFRFKPDGSKLEFLRNTNNNSWGVGFSEDGLLFGSTANGCPSVYMPIPNRYYEAVRGWSSSVLPNIAPDAKYHPITDKVRQVDHHGNFTSAAGHALYTARTYPPEYWNQTAFVADPTGHLVSTFQLTPNGADFKARYAWNLVASDDEWSAPIAAEVGPDGNVWVLDWYNFIVQHNPTPRGFTTGKGNAYESELRDKTHGRIYRVIHNGRKLTPAKTLHRATPDQLIDALTWDNMFWRRHAQRLLVERGNADVAPALWKLTENEAVDAVGLNVGAMHAIWTLQGLGAIDVKRLSEALQQPAFGVNRAALLALPRTEEGLRALIASRATAHPDGQVRLAAYLALAEMPPDSEAARVIATAWEMPNNDRLHHDALTAAAARHAAAFLAEIATQKNLTPAAFDAIPIVAEHFARGKPAQGVERIIAQLAKAPPRTAEAIIGGMAKGWPKGHALGLSEDADAKLGELLGRLPAASRGDLIKLALNGGTRSFEKQVASLVDSFAATLKDDKKPDAERIAAARQLAEFAPEKAGSLLAMVSPRTSPAVAAALIDAGSVHIDAGKFIAERYLSWPPSARLAGLRALIGRAANAKALLDAIGDGKIPLSDLSLDQKQALAAHPDAGIAKRANELLARGGALPSADRVAVLESLLPLAKKTGDATKGVAMFKKHCAACHQHSGEGQNIGPDLTGMAAHPKDELLVHILDPHRSVEGNFRVYLVEMKDGRILTGLLASETKTSVELIDAQAKRIALLRDDIDDLTGTTKSLMPEGFEKQMTAEEMTDLLEFLTRKGKYLPLPLTKVATISSARGMFHREDDELERLVFRDWKPKLVGEVPFVLVDPQDGRVPNVVLLNGPEGKFPPTMPKSVELPCNAKVKTVHILGGVSGWGSPLGTKGSVSMIVRLHYADGKTEDHELKNGEHLADYIRRVDVPGSTFAFSAARGQQVRYLSVAPKRTDPLTKIELIKGSDRTAPIVLGVTVELPGQ